MKSFSPRFLSALGLSFSLMSSTILSPVILSIPVRAQETQQSKQKINDQKQSGDKNKTNQANQAQANPSPTPSASAAAAKTVADKRPLSVNEDPAMIGKRNINKGFDKWMGGSQAKEVAMGRQYAAEIEKELKLVDDPMVTEYINRVGQNIVNHSDAKVPFTIKVVDSDEVNAFALPGGFFYVNKGLLLAADNESELVGVMAHEIGHVAARHVVEQQGKQTLISYGMLGAILATGGIAGNILYNTQGLIQGLIGLKYSRGAEEEADRLGVQYTYASGYDPNGMATMFEKLSAMNKKKAGKISKLFMTHPESLQRRDSALALISRFPEKDEYVLSTSEFQKVKNHLLRLSNAKASVTGDIDEGGGKPTLKRRQPTPDDSTSTPSTTSPDNKTDDKDKERPQLKRRGEEPKPTPSPEQ